MAETELERAEKRYAQAKARLLALKNREATKARKLDTRRKIILGGASNSRDLQDLSTLIGERDEYTDSVTLGDHGTRSNQRSIRRVPVLPPDRIRTLPFGTGITMLRSAPPIVTDLRAWPTRPDAAQLRSDRDELEALLRHRPAS